MNVRHMAHGQLSPRRNEVFHTSIPGLVDATRVFGGGRYSDPESRDGFRSASVAPRHGGHSHATSSTTSSSGADNRRSSPMRLLSPGSTRGGSCATSTFRQRDGSSPSQGSGCNVASPSPASLSMRSTDPVASTAGNDLAPSPSTSMAPSPSTSPRETSTPRRTAPPALNWVLAGRDFSRTTALVVQVRKREMSLMVEVLHLFLSGVSGKGLSRQGKVMVLPDGAS